MATNTFDRRLEITDIESVKKLIAIMESSEPVKPLSKHPYSELDRDKSKNLLAQCLSNSRRK